MSPRAMRNSTPLTSTITAIDFSHSSRNAHALRPDPVAMNPHMATQAEMKPSEPTHTRN